MTVRLSIGLRNLLVSGNGFGNIFTQGRMEIYSGSQPTTADAAITGVLLGTVTANSAALTKETRATGTFTLTGGSTSILTATVGGFNIIPTGAVPYNTSLAQTASDLADAINRAGMFEASSNGAVVTIRPPYGSGLTYNGSSLSTTGAVTATYVSMGSGVAPVNGLLFGAPLNGVIAKLPSVSQIWSFNGVAVGTAGWFRLYSSDTNDTGALLSGAPWYPRLDGSVGTSGADLNLSNIAITVSAPTSIDTFQFTMPAQ